MAQGSVLLQRHLNDISAIVVDFKISPNGSKLLRIVHDNGVLIVHIPHGSVEANNGVFPTLSAMNLKSTML